MKIYTKTGDKGQTSLVGGTKVSKGHLRIESYGTVDELNSWIGILRDQLQDEAMREELKHIQDTLFVIGSHLATESGKNVSFLPALKEEDTLLLEQSIDLFDSQLEPLKNFILPGGHPLVSQCHVARCVCRRAERLAVRLSEEDEVEGQLIVFLNRLSDYLFTLARKIGKDLGAAELPWNPKKS